MSLKQILNNLIQEKGEVSVNEVYAVCDELGYKRSNAERRLRESPSVKPIMSKKGAIVAYKWSNLLDGLLPPKTLVMAEKTPQTLFSDTTVGCNPNNLKRKYVFY